MKDSEAYKTHMHHFGDSLSKMFELIENKEYVADLNYYRMQDFEKAIKKKAPYGFLKAYNFGINSAGGVEPEFVFMNTSNKTIKYIDFYFQLLNPVNDVCYIELGSPKCRGVGPIEAGQIAHYNWEDDPVCYTTKSVSRMKVTKIHIIYMDGTERTLTKIIF